MAMTHCKECGEEISKSAKICPKCGKKQKKSIFKIVLGVIILIIIVAAASGSGNNTTNNSSQDTTATITQEKFTLVSSEMTSDSLSTYIEGTIKNNTDKTYSYAQVTFNIYDSNGNQLGTAVDNINNLQPNATWKYKAMGLTTEKVARYEFVEITGW